MLFIHFKVDVERIRREEARSDDTVFAPESSDLAVRFAAKPIIEEFQTTSVDARTLNGSRAELKMSGFFQRAEVFHMPNGTADLATREASAEQLMQYAKHNGLLAPEIKWAVTENGPCASLRATKILQDGDRQEAITYEAVSYYGEKSLLILYAGGLSANYPSTEVVKFFNSVSRNLKRGVQ